MNTIFDWIAGRRVVLAAGLAILLGVVAPMAHADVDPAVSQIAAFQASLEEVMKQGADLGAKGRARKLTPAVQRTFDLPAMTRFAVGPGWATLSDAERASLTEAFTHLTAASFAHNFASYNGERFDVDPKVDVRGIDKLVQSHITPNGGAPVSMVFRMRASGGTWKAIDVFYDGSISQLTTRRSDFAATMASGGASALTAHINAQAEKLLQ